MSDRDEREELDLPGAEEVAWCNKLIKLGNQRLEQIAKRENVIMRDIAEGKCSRKAHKAEQRAHVKERKAIEETQADLRRAIADYYKAVDGYSEAVDRKRMREG